MCIIVLFLLFRDNVGSLELLQQKPGSELPIGLPRFMYTVFAHFKPLQLVVTTVDIPVLSELAEHAASLSSFDFRNIKRVGHSKEMGIIQDTTTRLQVSELVCAPFRRSSLGSGHSQDIQRINRDGRTYCKPTGLIQ